MIDLSKFQSVIQLAAGLSFAGTFIPELRGFSERRAHRVCNEIDRQLQMAATFAFQGNVHFMNTDREISDARRKMLAIFLEGHDEAKEALKVAQGKILKIASDSENYDYILKLVSLAFGLFATFLLFLSSFPERNITEFFSNNALTDSEYLYIFNAICAALYIPMVLNLGHYFYTDKKFRPIVAEVDRAFSLMRDRVLAS